jgi:predicted aldo/keto reductase-like oxidoreductase
LKTAVVGGAALSVPASLPAAKRTATDWVTLGNSGVKVTRLAFGTGTKGGSVQMALGQDGFTRLVRHAYDRGVRFFETADAYGKGQMQTMLGTALKGIPRDSYKLMTKFRFREASDPQGTIDRFRRELNTEYLDILLIHCVRTSTWSNDLEKLRDAFSEAKVKKVIAAHGASCHGLLPIRTFPGNKWLDVALMRVNHAGTMMDNLRDENNQPGDVPEVVSHVKKVHAQGTGVLGMKIIGEGAFTDPEQREKSIRFVMGTRAVDSVTIGFKSPAEIDEAIERINSALA